MFENQKIILRRNNSNNLTKPQQINISTQNEKLIPNYTKKISADHREFGHDLTNLALTVFGNSNISQNKSVLKAIEIIKANKKNKERSREKSLLKENNRKVLCDKKNNSNVNNCDNVNKISEFELENEQKEENVQNNENIQKNVYINKISEVNIKLDKEIIQNNNFKINYGELSNINNNISTNEKIKDKYDLQFAEEYQEEIIPYLISLEYKKRINPNYMLKQNDINEKMRMILIDWLIEVHLKFKLLPETLFLTINFIDRYLQNNQTKRDKLQLIAVSSLLIACKYEEIYPPEISSFVYITDNAYKKEDILNYEIKILDDKTFYNKMMCLSELCLSKLIFYNFTYLELVLACALFLFEKNLFMTQCVIRHFGLGENYQKLEKINNCIFEIKKLLEYMNENKNIFKGVRQKYALEKYGCISMNEFL